MFRTKSLADALRAGSEQARLPLDPYLSVTLEAFQKETKKPVKDQNRRKAHGG